MLEMIVSLNYSISIFHNARFISNFFIALLSSLAFRQRLSKMLDKIQEATNKLLQLDSIKIDNVVNLLHYKATVVILVVASVIMSLQQVCILYQSIVLIRKLVLFVTPNFGLVRYFLSDNSLKFDPFTLPN